MTLIITTTVGLAQLSLVLAAPPPQGGNPHGDFDVTSPKGDPHSSVAPKGNPHLCETTGPGTGVGGGKLVAEPC